MRQIRTLIAVLLLASSAIAASFAYQYGVLFTSITAATTTKIGDDAALPVTDGHERPSKFTWQYTFAGGAQPTSHTTTLEGSIDGTNFFTLDTTSSITSTFSNGQQGEMRHVVNKSVRFVRCNITALTLGSATSETCQFIAEKP